MAMDDQYNPAGHRPDDADESGAARANDSQTDQSPAPLAQTSPSPVKPIDQPVGMGAYLPDQLDLSADVDLTGGDVRATREAARRKVSWGASIPIIITALLFVGAMIVAVSRGVMEITPADRAAVVTAEMVDDHTDDDLNIRKEPASFTKAAEGDGHRLEYLYDDIFYRDEGLMVRCVIVVADNEIDAKKAYSSLDTETRIDAKAIDGFEIVKPIEFDERDEMLAWGDTSRCAVLRRGKKLVGNYFLARKDRHVIMLMITGVCIEDAQKFRDLVQPKLDTLTDYDPTPAAPTQAEK